MKDAMLTKTGKLQKRFLPAVYFDSSVLIDYWMTEGMEVPETEVDELIKKNELPHLRIVREILRSDRRINKVVGIRKKLVFNEVKVTPVVSPLSLLELMEWQAEASRACCKLILHIFIYRYVKYGLSRLLMHILLAQHLGCQYIASFDSDFARIKDIINEESGMAVLNSPEEILDIL